MKTRRSKRPPPAAAPLAPSAPAHTETTPPDPAAAHAAPPMAVPIAIGVGNG